MIPMTAKTAATTPAEATDKPSILFACVHNIGRSQIAAALLAHHAGDGVEVRSTGSLPGAQVHPLVVKALKEPGIDLSGAYPKPLTDDVVRAADYVITMGCGDEPATSPAAPTTTSPPGRTPTSSPLSSPAAAETAQGRAALTMAARP